MVTTGVTEGEGGAKIEGGGNTFRIFFQNILYMKPEF